MTDNTAGLTGPNDTRDLQDLGELLTSMLLSVSPRSLTGDRGQVYVYRHDLRLIVAQMEKIWRAPPAPPRRNSTCTECGRQFWQPHTGQSHPFTFPTPTPDGEG